VTLPNLFLSSSSSVCLFIFLLSLLSLTLLLTDTCRHATLERATEYLCASVRHCEWVHSAGGEEGGVCEVQPSDVWVSVWYL
jgi:hypothetical protein